MVLKGNQAMRSLKRTKRENIKCKIKEKIIKWARGVLGKSLKKEKVEAIVLRFTERICEALFVMSSLKQLKIITPFKKKNWGVMLKIRYFQNHSGRCPYKTKELNLLCSEYLQLRSDLKGKLGKKPQTPKE